MKITNIHAGTQITINLVYNEKTYISTVTALTSYGQGLLITPIYCDGKIVDYCSDAYFTVKSPFSLEEHKFHINSLSRVDFSGSNFHVITGNECVATDQKRKSERIKIQKAAIVYLDKTQEINVMINDLSMRGISLLVGKNSKYFNVGDQITLDILKDGIFKHIRVNCTVVRQFKIGEYDAIGCELKNISTTLLEYIISKKKQKQELNSAKMFEIVS